MNIFYNFPIVIILCVFHISICKLVNDPCPAIATNTINVHIICHSHNDLGWIETVDEYYNHYVRNILNTVVSSLKANPYRKFVHAEIAYLYKWWKEQNLTIREDLKKLVKNNQFSIVGGGWSVNDEATAHFQSIIDQFTLGFRKLQEMLGKTATPNVGWQIDTFGHSQEMAHIFIEFGYSGIFLGRLDYRDRSSRLSQKRSEFLWKNGDDCIFSHVLYKHLGFPENFCFGLKAIDFISARNVKTKVDQFRSYVMNLTRHYPTNNILVTFNDDFAFQNARIIYENIDFLISAVNDDNENIKTFYSSPYCYIEAVNSVVNSKNLSLNIKTGDFFPYASSPHVYWTGFYTSRPTLKKIERDGNNMLQITKQLNSFIIPKNEHIPGLFDLQNIMGVMQHHDAITGTVKMRVAKDYLSHLSTAMDKSIKLNGAHLIKLIKNNNSKYKLQLHSCPLSNISICSYGYSDKFLVVLYNPLGRNISEYIKIPVQKTNFIIKTINNETVPYQITPTPIYLKKFIKTMDYEITFRASDIPPLGVKVYHVTTLGYANFLNSLGARELKFGNGLAGFKTDKYGYLKELTIRNVTIFANQQFFYYNSYRGQSGAYIFQPIAQATEFGRIKSFEVYKGELFEEIRQQLLWGEQSIRVYKDKNYIEFDWIMGPLGDNMEVISRFQTHLHSQDTFYTDSNGRGEIKRRRNYRSSFFYDADEGVTGNYYPVVSKILIKDEEKNMKFVVLTDRAQGGTSLLEGQLELMIHRRIAEDEEVGLEEALLESQFEIGAVARGQHYVTFSDLQSEYEEEIAFERLLKPWIFLADVRAISNYENLASSIQFEFSAIKQNLPDYVHLLTLEPLHVKENLLLLRLIYIKNLGEPIFVDINIFKVFKILTLKELSLAGEELSRKNKKFEWKYFNPTEEKYPDDLENFKIFLKPGKIRTFMIKVQYIQFFN